MTFGFNRGFTQGPNPNAAGAASGFGFASFTLGTPASGTVGFAAPVTETVKNFALYARDDWKVTPKLTLNLGLRWEVEGGITDRVNAIGNFDPNVTYAVNGINCKVGLAFPGVNGLSRGPPRPPRAAAAAARASLPDRVGVPFHPPGWPF